MVRASVLIASTLALALAGCSATGRTEKSGDVGEVLEAKGLQANVKRVDTHVPVPANDITGLSTPTPGKKLVGAFVTVCSNHPGAIGSFDFGLESSEGDGTQKFPQMNYAKGFDTVRADCGDGWVVFEIPTGAHPEKVTFDFQDTGTSMDESNNVDAHFSWAIG